MLPRLLVVLPAIVAVVAHGADPDREKKMAAVNKAAELMESLRASVLKEGEEEAQSYNKFACFCKDTTTDRLAAIRRGEDEQGTLTALINTLSGKRDTLDGTISDKETAISGLEADMKAARASRRATLETYEGNTADLRAALDGLSGAIKSLKSSKTPSLVELKSVSETVRTAAALADALGLSSQKNGALTALLQQPANDVQMEDYKFHSNDIIATLEGLQADFTKTKDDVDKEEVVSVRDHELLMQEKTHLKKLATNELERARKKRSETIDALAMASEELSSVEANLRQDKEYTDKLSLMCTHTAQTWDQRKRIRADELATLTEAIGMIEGAVAGNVSSKTIRFAQQSTNVQFAKTVAANVGAMEDIEAAAEAADTAPVFAQLQQHGRLRASVRRTLASPGDGREAVAEILKSSGLKLKSTLLSALASRLAADPFAKVKQLIGELIERLLQEASNEANQKGWCDKSIADAKQKREFAAEEIADLNSQMANFEATRDQLIEDISTLDSDILEVEGVRDTAVAERNESSLENGRTVDEAQQGLDALNLCIELLDKFYKTIKKEKVDLSLAQQGPSDDAPNAGFEIGEAYTGGQSEAGGILGMLDVMKSDFVRTIEETNLAEEKAQDDHREFMTETGSTLAEKNEVRSSKLDQKGDVVGKHDDAKQSLEQQASTLVTSIDELKELKETCIDTGMSYDERVARREDEIASLNRAMCIFTNYEKYGPEGASSSC